MTVHDPMLAQELARRSPSHPSSRRPGADEALQVWRVIRTHGLAIALVAVVVLGATVAFTWRQVPIYRASTKLRIEPAQAQVVKFDDVNAPVGNFNRLQYQQYYTTQYEILRSRAIASQATTLLRDSHGVALFPDARDAVDVLLRSTTITPVPDSQLVDIQVEHRDPRLAALAADTIAEAFSKANLEQRLSTVDQAARFLDRQFEDWKQRKVDSERKLLDYKEKQDIFDLEDRQTLAVKQLSSASSAWEDARGRLTAAEAQYRKLMELSRTPEGRNAMPGLLEVPGVADLVSNESRARMAFTQAAERYGEQHPILQQARAELATATQLLDQAVQRALDTSRARYELARQEEKQRSEDVARAKDEVSGLARRSVDLGVLKAEVDRNERFFQTLDTRRAETDISALLRNNNIYIVDKAQIPQEPVRPVWALNLVLAVALGLVLGVGVAFGVDYADNSVKSPEELEAYGLNHLAAIPSLSGGRGSDQVLDPGGRRLPEVLTDPRSPAAECYRVLRTNLRFVSLSRPTQVLVVTSASPRDGKSTTAANLAATLASSGQRVLLVDSDLRRPCLHRIFGLGNSVGLTNVLMGEMSLDEAIQETGVPGLHLLSSGALPPNPAEVLASDAMERLLEPARRGYHTILCDSSPVLAVTDPVVLASQADGVIFVIRHRTTTRDVLRAAMRTLSDVREKVLGFVMNDLDTSVGYYPYHYVYYSQDDGEGKEGSREASRGAAGA